MEAIPQYWHNNAPNFVAALLITSFISIIVLYFYAFFYVFAWEMFQSLTVALLANTSMIINLSVAMAIISYPSAIAISIGMFVAEDELDFGAFGTILLSIVIGGIFGMVTTWLFFTLAIKEMLLISAIFSIVNVLLLIILFLITSALQEMTNITLNNWYFRLFGKGLLLDDIKENQLKKLILWLNLNTEKWYICVETKKVYVISDADFISLKLTFYNKGSNLGN